jgi:glycosyltransferase involved in cell wall biosynthesis
VDATSLANPRGYGRFTRELLAALMVLPTHAHWLLFTDERARARAEILAHLALEAGVTADVITVPQSVSPTLAASADGARSPADMLRFTRAVHRARVQVFFSPTVYTYFPVPPGVRLLACFHDTIAEDYPEMTLPSRRARLFWGAKARLALAQARLVLTVSNYSARRLMQVYGVAEPQLRVAVEAASAEYQPATAPGDAARIAAVAARYGIPAHVPWFIYVGGFNPHKHVDRLVGAHARLRRDTQRDVHLVLVGPSDDVFHGSASEIRERLRTEGTQPHVSFTGFVPDDELRYLLAGAVALVLPSEAEGFGLPAVEAAACGTPVIATTNSPLPELLAGGGFFVAPRDDAALLDAMTTLLLHETVRERCAEAALTAVRRLDWGQAAQSTWRAIREVAA